MKKEHRKTAKEDYEDGVKLTKAEYARLLALCDERKGYSLEMARKKFTDGLAIPGRVPSSDHRMVELILSTRPEAKGASVISDEDISNCWLVEALESREIIRRLKAKKP